MRRLLVVITMCAGLGWTQGNNSDLSKPGESPRSQESSVVMCKLETVTWNPEKAELTWVISIGDAGTGKEHPQVTETYTIHLDTATMNFKGEARRFSQDEAQQVAKLMDVLGTYTVESTVWWSEGMGEKIDGTTGSKPDPKPQDNKKDDKSTPATPGQRVADMPGAAVHPLPWLPQSSSLHR